MQFISPKESINEMRSIFTYNDIEAKQKIIQSDDLLSAPSARSVTNRDEDVHLFIPPRRQAVCSEKGQQNTFQIQVQKVNGVQRVYSQQTKCVSSKFRMLNKRIFSLINDKASDFKVIKLEDYHVKPKSKSLFGQNLRFFIKSLCKHLDEKVPIILLNSRFLRFYQMLMVFALIINLFYVPLLISFLQYDTDEDNLVFNLLPNLLFIIWILISCNTEFFIDVSSIQKRTDIIINYVKTDFLLDIIIVIPYLFKFSLGNFAELTIFLKFYQLRKIMSQLEYNFKEDIQTIFDILKLILFLLYATHFCACIWHYLALKEREANIPNWIDDKNMGHLPWSDRYVTSLYWSVITSLTVGYGDITPQSKYEQIFVIFVAFTLCGMLGYTVTSIGEIFRLMREKNIQYVQYMKSIDLELKRRQISSHLQIKIKIFFKQLFQLEQEENQMGEQQFNKLSKSLSEELMIDSYKKYLQQSILLKHFKLKTIEKLCTKIQLIKTGPGVEVVKSRQQSDQLIFLLDGQVNILASDADQQIILKHLLPNQCIGEEKFVQQGFYDYSMVSVGYSRLAFLSRADFYEILRTDQEELEKFFELRDELIFNIQSKNLVGNVCEICGWTHSYLKCPFSFLQLDKLQVIKRNNKNVSQDRHRYIHRRMNKYNARLYLFRNQDTALNFLQHQNSDENSFSSKSYGNIQSQYNLSNKNIEETREHKRVSFNDLHEKLQSFQQEDKQKTDARKSKRGTNSAETMNQILPALNDYYAELLQSIIQKLNQIERGQQKTQEDIPQHFEEDLFDQVCNFNFYFPKQNISSIIQRLNVRKEKKSHYKLQYFLASKRSMIKKEQ
ncbi:hypothetical protein pb186bvf_002304 [Paramecium bursaria]